MRRAEPNLPQPWADLATPLTIDLQRRTVEEMKRIRFAGGSFTTGDDISDVVLDYAAELANAGKAARIEVPAVSLEQLPERVSLVIGPASQLLAEPIAASLELIDEEFVVELRLRTRVLQQKSGMADGADAAAFKKLRAS